MNTKPKRLTLRPTDPTVRVVLELERLAHKMRTVKPPRPVLSPSVVAREKWLAEHRLTCDPMTLFVGGNLDRSEIPLRISSAWHLLEMEPLGIPQG